MTSLEMDQSFLRQLFSEEASEHLAGLNSALLALEKAPDDEALLREAFRLAHSLKGGARAVGEEEIARLALAMEDVLARVRNHEEALNASVLDGLFQTLDALKELFTASGPSASPPALDAETALPATTAPPPAAAPPGPPPAAPHHPAHEAREMIRVSAHRLDLVLDLAGELMTHRQDDAQHLRGLAQRVTQLDALQARLASAALSPALAELAHLLGVQLHQVERDLLHLNQLEQEVTYLVDTLQGEVMSLRLVGVEGLLHSLERPIRDMAREMNKQVRVAVEAGKTILDRKIIEALADPLIHMARNAMDHGIESAAERQRLGKPAEGVITLRAHSEGSQVVIEMQDDGRGIQWERLVQSAVEKGIISRERASTLSATETFELLFVSGLSTSARVTTLSGRGVGMDVVRDSVRQLGGQVDVVSQADQFTRVRLVLPLTLSLTHALICRVGTRLYAIPMANVVGSVTVPQEAVRTLGGEETLLLEDATMPLLRLNRVLGLPEPEQRQTITCVLLRRLEGPLAYVVDALEDEREIVLKPLGRALAKNPLFSAGTILSGGRIVLVLNAATLASPQALREIATLGATLPALGRAARPAAPPHARRILVVDDSITTRELERSILQSAGYEAEVAVDGLDALERLAHGHYDLIVTDIEMPRMDGFALTQRVRADARLRELPVIAVTARENDEDRRRGLECGASAYIAKSTFAQDNLLQTVRSLLG